MKDQTAASAKRKPYDFDARKPRNLGGSRVGRGHKGGRAQAARRRGYAGSDALGDGLEVVRRREGERGFAVLPRRRAVEWTPAWLSKYRRMSEDRERLSETSDARIRLAMVTPLTLRRLAT